MNFNQKLGNMLNFKNWSKRKKIIVGIIVVIIIGISSNQSDTTSTTEKSDSKGKIKSVNLDGIYTFEGSYNSSAQFIVSGKKITGYYGYSIGDRTYLENNESVSHYINNMNQIIFHDKILNREIIKGEITNDGVLKYQTETGLITAKK